MENLINLVSGFWGSIDQYVVAVLSILGGFSVLAKLTPTEADDKVIATIINFIHTVGLTKKK